MSAATGLQLSMPLRRRRAVPQLVITDVDNTLYDFGSYYEAGLRGLVATAVSLLSMSEQQVLSALRSVYERRGSIEYPFALEEFPEVVALPLETRAEALHEMAGAFWSEAAQALVPYPGVLEALRTLSVDGVDVVAFTDAPIHEAVRRLRGLGVDRYLSGVVATQWFGPRSRGTAVMSVYDVPGMTRVPRRLRLVGRLRDDERKPNPATFGRIAALFEIDAAQVTVIGDSPARDLAPAAALGMRPVWARYGRRTPEREILLQQIVPFRLPEITAKQDDAAAAYEAVDRFDEILELLPTQQLLPLRARW
ncbi:MAG: HAD family hydrolase [Actinomycetota bacterium]|nr:HAD family hydrolase [Actinomycetota bacterium]